MKVFEFRYDTDDYSVFAPPDGYGEAHILLRHALYGSEHLRNKWSPRNYIRADPNLPVPDFIECGGLTVAITSCAFLVPEIKGWLEEAGELLPVRFGHDGCGFFLHCMKVISNSVNFRLSRGTKYPRGWAFDKLVLKTIPFTITTIFRLSEGGKVLLADTMDGTSGSFRHVYEREGLTGLKFIEVPVMDE